METSSQPINLDSVTVADRQDRNSEIEDLRSGGTSAVNDIMQGRFMGNDPGVLVQNENEMELIADYEAKLAKTIDVDPSFGEKAIARCHELIKELAGESNGQSSKAHCELQALVGHPDVMLQPGYVEVVGHLIESSYDSAVMHDLFTNERLDRYEFVTALKDGIDERHLPVMMDILQSNAMTTPQRSGLENDISLAVDNQARVLRSMAQALIAFEANAKTESFELRLMLLEQLCRDGFWKDQNLEDEIEALRKGFSAAEIDSIIERDDVPYVKRSLL